MAAAVLFDAVLKSYGCRFLPFGSNGKARVAGRCRQDDGDGIFRVFCFPVLSPSRRYCSDAAGRPRKF
jgi:hypothetical protein